MDSYQQTTAVQRGYSGTSGAMSNASAYDNPPIEPGSVIRNVLDAHESTVAELHDTISRFEARLDTALTPMPPQPASTTSAPSGPPCSLVASRLVTLNGAYRHAIERLRELTQRVEV